MDGNDITLAQLAIELLDLDGQREQLRERAARQGGRAVLVDPEFTAKAGQAPNEAIIGYYSADYLRVNPKYRPTPTALRLPAPTDPMDRAVQRLATGWGSLDQLCESMLDSDIYVEVDANGKTRRDSDTGDGMPIFTDPKHIPEPRQGRAIPFDYLLNNLVPGLALAINPETRVFLRDDISFRISASIDAGFFLDYRKRRRADGRPSLPLFPNL